MKKIKSALISVFYKDGLDEIVKTLAAGGVKLYSTGGTLSFIESLGLEATAVEDLTGYPSILGGRVKTLHPSVFGGILGRRDNEGDREQMAKYAIPEIDLVIVDLYPFEQTVASGAEEQAIIEKIDIGGISLIRAAAKNFKDTVIVPSVEQYGELLALLKEQDCSTTIEQRRRFAALAFSVSNTVSTSNKSTPPSTNASICSIYALLRVSKSIARNAGFSTSGDIDKLFAVGPIEPATKRGRSAVIALILSASARAKRAASVFRRRTCSCRPYSA